MSAGIVADDYVTVVTALTNTNKTAVYSVGTDEDGAHVTSISINNADSSAAAAPLIVYITIGTGITEQVFLYRATDVEVDWPLEIIGRPIALRPGGVISVTGANTLNVWVTYKRVQTLGTQAQKR